MSSKLAFSERAFIVLSCNGHGRKLLGARHLPGRIEMQWKASSPQRVEEEDNTRLEVQKLSISRHGCASKNDSNLKFNKLQQPERYEECRVFGEYVARQAIIDEEYWTAAYLRAEAHWEDRPNERYADSYRRQFADQEYTSLKRRCKGYNGQNCTCIVAVKKEDKNVKRTVIKSVAGTLDLNIRYLLNSESFPGEKGKTPPFCSLVDCSKYGYISNLCVRKSSRRRSIAINMLSFAIGSARSKGAEQIFVHVNRHNTAAQKLYQKLDFQIVDEASPLLEEEQMYLLCLKIECNQSQG